MSGNMYKKGDHMENIEKKIFVVGHKNPDTDSICSAIAYANLKRIITGKPYEAKRAGKVNSETQYVLDYFKIKEPELITDVRTQVKDIEIRETKGVAANISLKKAWGLMKDEGVVTLPITKRKRLEGLITIGDIANSYMNVYDSKILSDAKTQYSNIVETLEGTVIIGDAQKYFDKGKVLIAAANPDLMENYIEPGDLVILGNRYESQLCAIEMNAACIIVCEGAPISLTIRKLAEGRSCTLISTPYDTYTAARLINQSMPISYFMKTDKLITFNTDDFTDDIYGTMAKIRHRDFPILDKSGSYIGMISRRNLLGMQRKKIILVDHNEKTQAVDGIESAEILEIIDHHRLGTIETMAPVFFRNQPLGCTATIIYQMYMEAGVEIEREIAGILCGAIISDTLLYRSPTCTMVDKISAQSLAQIAGIVPEMFAKDMFTAGSNLKNKSTAEILYQDFKRFNIEDTAVGVGQINSMNVDELNEIKDRLVLFIEKERSKNGLDMVFFMMTSILDESTELICCGSGAQNLVEDCFNVKMENNAAWLPGVVSRKKQLIPQIMMGLQK